jgi:hypothetical protein
MEDIKHGGIEPDPDLPGRSGDTIAIQTFLDEPGRFHIFHPCCSLPDQRSRGDRTAPLLRASGQSRGPAFTTPQRAPGSNDQAGPRPHSPHPPGAAQARLEERIMVVKFAQNDRGNPPGKLADAELHFGEGTLDGLKLIGFGIWERKGGNGRNVTFPARQYSVNGERRSFALLRPIVDAAAQERVREFILQAYAEYEEQLVAAD